MVFLIHAKQTQTITQMQVTNASALSFRVALVLFVRN
jgi:hypothetical protein